MPIQDWTRVPAGLFHHFHQDWSVEIVRALNRGILPKGVAALVGFSLVAYTANNAFSYRRSPIHSKDRRNGKACVAAVNS